MSSEERGECLSVAETVNQRFMIKTDVKEKNMNEFADDFIQGFSQKLPVFYKFYCEWWAIEKMVNNSFPDLSKEDITFWCCMQIFAENQVKQFAKDLPDNGKEVIKTVKEKIGVKQ